MTIEVSGPSSVSRYLFPLLFVFRCFGAYFRREKRISLIADLLNTNRPGNITKHR